MTCSYAPTIFHSAFMTPWASFVGIVGVRETNWCALTSDAQHHSTGSLYPPKDLSGSNTKREDMLLTFLWVCKNHVSRIAYLINLLAKLMGHSILWEDKLASCLCRSLFHVQQKRGLHLYSCCPQETAFQPSMKDVLPGQQMHPLQPPNQNLPPCSALCWMPIRESVSWWSQVMSGKTKGLWH